MELFLKYLKQKLGLFVVGMTFSLIFTVSFFLYHLPVEAVIYPTILCIFIGILVLIFDFMLKNAHHKKLTQVKSIDDALTTTFPFDNNIQNEDYRKIISLICKQHKQYQLETNNKYMDMIEYYTVWAHQIKTPNAAMLLTLQNEDSPLSRKLTNDLYRIEQYVEMVMTFLRLNSNSTDYVFKEYDLDTIVRSAVKKFSSEFIDRKLRLIYEPLNTSVITDEKWLSFVIEQVLSNALKYTPDGSIKISLVKEKTLRIEDTGIGIAPSDLPRIFDNGYTGFNGRTDKRASGIGLYLCKRICNNLGHGITANSKVDVGTIIDIDLSQFKIETE